MGNTRDFKFGMHIERQMYKPKNANIGQKGHGLRHGTYFYHLYNPSPSFLIFGRPLHLWK